MKLLVIILFLITNCILGQSMEKINYKKIPGKEAKAKIKNYNGKLVSSIEETYYIEVFELNNKEAIMDFHSHGFLFKTVNDAIIYLKSISSRVSTGRQHHILEGIFNYDSSFLYKVKELQGNLGFKNPLYTENELKKVDALINKKLKSGLSPDSMYSSILAYIGEYIIHQLKDAKWEILKVENINVWEPYIVDSKNNYYRPFLVVYKELYEYFPIEGKVELNDHTKIELIQYNINVK